MNIALLTASLVFVTINLCADKNWIPIEPITQASTFKEKSQKDRNLSQIEPINKMIKNITVVKQLVDGTQTKEKNIKSDKNWYLLEDMENK
jgi:hypothetical protein